MSPVDAKELIGKEFWLNRHIRGWGRVQVIAVDEISDGSIVRVRDLSDNGQYPASRDSLKVRLSAKEQQEADRQAQKPEIDWAAVKSRHEDAGANIRVINDKIEALERQRQKWVEYRDKGGKRP